MSRARCSSLLRLLTVAALAAHAGCDAIAHQTGSGTSGGVGGKADGLGLGEGGVLVLAAPGAFDVRDGAARIARIHYGVGDRPERGWPALGDVPLVFDESGRSEAVVIELPEHAREGFLGFLFLDEGGSPVAGNLEQFVDLGRPDGAFAPLPIESVAPYPFAPSCYQVRAADVAAGGVATFDGRAREVLVGFTAASLDDYLADADVPWEDVTGAPTLVGAIPSVHRHDGGYKGTMRLDPAWLRVPDGRDLVFKARVDRFAGGCASGGEATLIESSLTRTFFHEVAVP